MRSVMFPILLGLALSACGKSETADTGEDASSRKAVASSAAEGGQTAEVDTQTSAPSSAPTDSTVSLSETADGGEWTFEYSWPAAVGAIPALATRLTRERDRLQRDEKAEWRKMAEECPTDSIACRTRSLSKEWEVVADLPRYLSLSADIVTYMGGAHGYYTRESLIWDKERAAGVQGVGLFKSPMALGDALGDRFCRALDRERADRRGGRVTRGEGFFSDCPGMDELVVFVGSSGGGKFDRLTLYAAPYVAGSYAEGDFTIDLNVDSAVIDTVKPEYRAAFRRRN